MGGRRDAKEASRSVPRASRDARRARNSEEMASREGKLPCVRSREASRASRAPAFVSHQGSFASHGPTEASRGPFFASQVASRASQGPALASHPPCLRIRRAISRLTSLAARLTGHSSRLAPGWELRTAPLASRVPREDFGAFRCSSPGISGQIPEPMEGGQPKCRGETRDLASHGCRRPPRRSSTMARGPIFSGGRMPPSVSSRSTCGRTILRQIQESRA